MVLVVFTVYVPCNKGLQYVREQGLDFLNKKFNGFELIVQEQRGEDIPRLVERLYNENNPVVGLTGKDLLDNYLLEEFGEDKFIRDNLRKRLVVKNLELKNKGPYKNSVFGLPALCILGCGGISLDLFVDAYPIVRDREITLLKGTELQEPNFKGKRIAIPERYEKLIRSRVRLTGAKILPLEGKVEVTAARDNADYAIDIVLTGRTCRKEGLGLFPPILYLSDGIILGNKKAQEGSNRRKMEFSDFDLWMNTGRDMRRCEMGSYNFSH